MENGVKIILTRFDDDVTLKDLAKSKPEKIRWTREVKQIWQGKQTLNLEGKKSKLALDKKDKTYIGEKAMEVSNSFGSGQNQVRLVVSARSDISGVVLLVCLPPWQVQRKVPLSDHSLAPVKIDRVFTMNFSE